MCCFVGQFIAHLITNLLMEEWQQEYREQLSAILSSSSSTKVKKLLLENLVNTVKEMDSLSKDCELVKGRGNCEVLSTCISECWSTNFQTEKDVQELQEKIMKVRMVKFQNNEDIETMEEELYQMEQIVKARIEYNDYLKKKIDRQMQGIQKVQDSKASRDKSRSVLNKSLDAVAGVLKISKWWG